MPRIQHRALRRMRQAHATVPPGFAPPAGATARPRGRGVRTLSLLVVVALAWAALDGRMIGGHGVRRGPHADALATAGVNSSLSAAAAVALQLRSDTGNVVPTLRPVPVRAVHAAAPTTYLIVTVTSSRTIRSGPGRGRVVGVLPSRSRWITSPLRVWVMDVSENGRYGKIAIPWDPAHRTGWFNLRGLSRTRTRYEVIADLSRHTLSVYRWGKRLFTVATGTGAPISPTPPGVYFVTDRAPFSRWSSFGSYLFGLSGIQTHLPPGWRGGNLLAIHGTNNPGSIGRSASAGCLRVSESTLRILERILVLGSPVIVQR